MNSSKLENNLSDSRTMRIALVYDRVNKWGGAERVLLALHELFPDAPLYTSVYSKDDALWSDVFDVRPSFLQKIPKARKLHEFFALFMPIAFESFDFSEFDVVISVTSEAAKGILTTPKTKHIMICLTPTRYLWSGYDEYFKSSFFRFISKPVVSYLRMWDKVAAQRPDAIVAISQTVQNRIQKYYDRESTIIYPPVVLEEREKDKVKSGIKHNTSSFLLSPSPYFLVVSRLSKLTSYKRVDLAIKAANRLKLPLKIVGTGRDLSHYQKMAGPTVEFLGYVSDEKLKELYIQSQALIFPGKEDFGLVMAEAQLFGVPVIAYKAGGAREIIKPGSTGEFFDKQTINSLCEAIDKFDKNRYNRETIIENARRFSKDSFQKSFLAFFESAITTD